LGFVDRFSVVDPVGLSGGLLLLWDSNVNIINIMHKSFYIAVEFALAAGPSQWGIFVYMSTCKITRMQQWVEMERDKACWGSKRFTMGDWNDIRFKEEKSGGKPRSDRSFLGFNTFISNMEMEELPMQGYNYTWCNLREAEGLVEEKLDRAFASTDWLMDSPNATVSNKIRGASDHFLLLLSQGTGQHKIPARFHFERKWLNMEGINEIVTSSWSQQATGTPFFKVKEKVKNTRAALLIWSSKFRSKNQQSIDLLTKKLEVLREDKAEDYGEQWNATRTELNAAHKQEELHWQQRSKVKWLKEGDSNTKFFHAYTLQKRKQNAISRLLTPSGRVLTSHEDIENHISTFYSELFTSEGSWDEESIVHLIPQTISDDMNQTLLKPVSEEEVRAALFSLPLEKSPGEDGMNALFFQLFWNI
ncbi:Unknown protein, partial [Striga hermonthica]